RAHEADGARAEQELQAVPHAEDGEHQQRRLLELELLHSGRLLASALDEPLGQALRRAADRSELAALPAPGEPPGAGDPPGGLRRAPTMRERFRGCPRWRYQH